MATFAIFPTSIGDVQLVPINKSEYRFEVYHAETDEYFGIIEGFPTRLTAQKHIDNFYKTKFNH